MKDGRKTITWQIYIGPFEQHTIVADNEAHAIKKWCNEQGYDSPGHAAGEYEGMTEKDVRAKIIDIFVLD